MTPLRSVVEHDRRQAVFRERKPSVRDGQYNPLVAEGVRWLDYERAAEAGGVTARDGSPEGPATLSPPADSQSDAFLYDGEPPADRLDAGEGDWFDGPRRPPRLADSRPYGVPGGLAQPDPQVERDLAEALRPGDRFPDPRGTWVRLINGGGPGDDPFRASNAADCALAVLSTWHGEPAAAAPRFPEYDRIGRPLLTGEQGSLHRIERWVGHRFQYAGQGRHGYPMIARRLLDAGHGASAVIAVRWPGGGSHAWNAVNADGEVIWIDAQRGHMSVEPPYTTVTGVFCVLLDRQGRPR
ncbi:toxin glutamine deamidase domain-containing protein [Nonomuraea sp. NPDC049695]|uniref:toxin glutamine deamidase domain-containing protein n=1 Tax=Nonomuraea sp. NPDC049695 TaxID=3154734 RepID=UPI003449480F